MTLVFATENEGKVREASGILGGLIDLMTPLEAGVEGSAVEDADTLEENSLKKAAYVYERCGMSCFADDTGLEVDALGGAPGVMTARYAGPEHSDDANIDKLLRELDRTAGSSAGSGAPGRTARFRTVVTLMLDGEVRRFEGVMEGTIATARHGDGGFGYDPVFIPDYLPAAECSYGSLAGQGPGGLVPNAEGLTLAQIPQWQKNAISHRGIALRKMASWLSSPGR